MSRFKNNEFEHRYKKNQIDKEVSPIKITHLDGVPLDRVPIDDMEQINSDSLDESYKMVARRESAETAIEATSKKRALPKIGDSTQRKSARNIALFLAIMVILTIIARGASAATLASVSTDTVSKGEIVDEYRGNAMVKVSDKTEIHIPEGLTIKEVLVFGGQEIEEGTDIVKVDIDELKEKLDREKIALNDLELKLEQLLQQDITDNTSLSQARQALTWAQQDLSDTKNKAKKDIQNAEDKLEKAKKELSDLKNMPRSALDVEPQTKTDEDEDGYEENSNPTGDINIDELIKEAQAKVDDLTENLSAVKIQADQEIKSSERAVESAVAALNSAEIGASKTQQDKNNAENQNQVDAAEKRLDIEAQKKKIDELNRIYENNGTAKSDKAGTVLETQNAYEKTTEQPVIKLADNGGGIDAEMTITDKDAEKINVGDTVDISDNSSGYSAEPLEGKVIEISESDAEENRKVKISLPDKKWKPNQNLDVRISRSREKFNECIPISGLRSDNSGYYILVVESKTTILGTENVIERIPVTLEGKDESTAAISGGFGRDAKIVIGSDKPIEAGSRVRLEE